MRKLGILFAILLLIGTVNAASVDYQIIGNRVLVEANFGEAENFELLLPYDIELFESNSFYNLTESGNHKLLSVDKSNNLSFSYVAPSMVEESSKHSFFILNSYFSYRVDVRLFLPEAGVLMEDFSLIFPSNADIGTDGRRVILEWKNFQDDEIVVGYEVIKEGANFWIYLFLVLLIGFGVVYVYQSRKLKKKIKSLKGKTKKTKEDKKKDVTRNLFREEKQIIEYLMEKKGHSCWTKELSNDLDISKVKLSRKLRILEEKELISREPHGNENRITLIKKS